MRKTLVALAVLILTGCAALDGKLDNRVACTAAKDKAFVVSEWGPIGITGKLHDADRAVVCK